ncbi:MAG: hypothetical protein K6G12_11455 [Lachnospiraceae bacterium]|nr:hypothetical protein [Lachnospiraceae bacterium]
MIIYEEAYRKAKEIRPDINLCTEYENAYVFGAKEDENYIGGYGHTPVVIIKEDGLVTNMLELEVIGAGKEIRSIFV